MDGRAGGGGGGGLRAVRPGFCLLMGVAAVGLVAAPLLGAPLVSILLVGLLLLCPLLMWVPYRSVRRIDEVTGDERSRRG